MHHSTGQLLPWFFHSSAAILLALAALDCGAQNLQDSPTTASSAVPAQRAEPSAPTVAPTSSAAPEPVASSSAQAPPPPPPVPGFTGIPETHKGKFPGLRPPKARMFLLKPGAQGGAESCAPVVGSDGHLCSRIVEPGAEINATHIERVTDLLSDARGFTTQAGKCYEPQHALVFYDAKGVPLGWSEVSLSCGTLTARPWLTGVPKKEDRYTLSGAGLAYLRGLCKTLKLDPCEPPAGAK